MRAHLSLKSANAKTGPIPVATISKASCPTSCPHLVGGCYARVSAMQIHWAQVTDGRRGTEWEAFCAAVAALPPLQVWRYGQAGDLPGEGDAIDSRALWQLATANAGRPVIAYTHKPVLGSREASRNAFMIGCAISDGFSIALSADNPVEADQLADLAIAPVVTILPHAYARKTIRKGAGAGPNWKPHQWAETLEQWRDRTAALPTTTPGGRRIAVCPATYTDTNCASCRACTRPDRKEVIGFPAHGSSWKKVEIDAGLIP